MGAIFSRRSSGEKLAGHFCNDLLVESIGGGRLAFDDSTSVFCVLINSIVRVETLFPLIEVSFVVIVSSFFIMIVVV
jgi:hypothetical protein